MQTFKMAHRLSVCPEYLRSEKDARLNNKMVLSLRSMPPPSPATKGMTMSSAGSSVTQLHWCRAVARTIYIDGHTQHASKENSVLQHAYKKIHKAVHVFTYGLPRDNQEASREMSAMWNPPLRRAGS